MKRYFERPLTCEEEEWYRKELKRSMNIKLRKGSFNEALEAIRSLSKEGIFDGIAEIWDELKEEEKNKKDE